MTVPFTDITVVQYATQADRDAGVPLRVIVLRSDPPADPSTPMRSETIVREGADLTADTELRDAAVASSDIVDRLKTEDAGDAIAMPGDLGASLKP